MSQTIKRAFVGLSLLSVVAVLPLSDAEAKVVKFLATTSDFEANTPSNFVPLDTAGATSRTFSLPRSGKIVITYNAECVVAGNASTFVSIDILLNGQVVAPSNAPGNGDKLCAGNSTIEYDSNVRATFVVVGNGKKGTNTLRIRATLVNGGGAYYLLGEQTLLIER
jgi:hypothetical protein